MIRLEKKTLIVSSFAPPMKGSSAHFLYTLLSHIDPSTYGLYTDQQARNPELEHPRLPCLYSYFPTLTSNRSGSLRIIHAISLFWESLLTGLRTIRSNDYELLLATADSGRALFLTLALSLVSGRPYALYFLDLYRWNNLSREERFFATLLEPILFRYAKKIFVMGDGHRRFYEKKYGARFSYTVIRNCPLPSPKRTHAPRTVPPYTILYSGGVYWAQEQALRNLIAAVSTLDLPVQAVLYTPGHLARFKKEFEHNDRVVFHSAPQRAMADIQNDADILFLPLSFHTKAPEVIEMATPGKTAEYLLAERPILVHAPAYSFLSQYAREKQFAHVIDTDNVAELQRGIKKLLLDKPYADSLVGNAKKLYEEEYNLELHAQHFAESIASA